jgi:hypothetical protein
LSNPGKIYFTGHSLGGALAQYAAYEYLQTLSASQKSRVSLITFNAFGGVDGIKQNLGGYDSTVIAGIDVANFTAKGDVVRLLGEGHVGGNTFQIDYGNRNFLSAHTLPTSFLSPANIGIPLLSSIPVSLPYLHLENAQRIAAAFGNLFNPDKQYSEFEAGLRTIGGMLVGLELGSRNDVDQLVDLLLPQYASVDWGIVRDSFPAGANILATGFGFGLIATAALYDQARLAPTRVTEANAFLSRITGVDLTPVQPLSSGQGQLQLAFYLASIPNAVANSALNGVLAGLNIDRTELAQKILSGGDW